jgi:hypothetical protein
MLFFTPNLFSTPPIKRKISNLKFGGTIRVKPTITYIDSSIRIKKGEKVWSPVELKNDDGTQYYIFTKNFEYAAQFNPSLNSFILEDIKLAFGNPASTSAGGQECYVYVYGHNSTWGTPGAVFFSGKFTLPSIDPGTWVWITTDLSHYHKTITEDIIWIGCATPWASPTAPPFLCGDESAPDNSNRNAYYEFGNPWVLYNESDFMIRAIITKTPSTYWPISGETTMDTITSAYGPRDKTPGTGYTYHFHRGVDIRARSALPVYAVESGKVVYCDEHSSDGYGNLIIIEHKYNSTIKYYSYYAHLSDITIYQI